MKHGFYIWISFNWFELVFMDIYATLSSEEELIIESSQCENFMLVNEHQRTNKEPSLEFDFYFNGFPLETTGPNFQV